MHAPFKYHSSDTFLNGQAINGYETFVWTERYLDPSSFEIEGKLSSGLLTFLPKGTVISHTHTLEAMIVENHQISEDVDTDPKIKITGRGFETVLEERVVGQNWDWGTPPASLAVSVYTLPIDFTWIQSQTLIDDHIRTGVVIDPDDAIPNTIAGLAATWPIIGDAPVDEERIIKRGPVFDQLKELLAIDGLGIRSIRRHNFSGVPHAGSNTTLEVHGGTDKRNSVKFSNENGDIDVAEYLWSIKQYKNAALVTGKFVEQFYPGTETGRDRRVLYVDGNDLDGHLETIPTGATLTAIRAAMTVRAKQALQSQRRIAFSRLDISETPTYHYRHDYNIGDLVSVDSSYGEVVSMRVIEFTEIQDETGETTQPTLEIIEE